MRWSTTRAQPPNTALLRNHGYAVVACEHAEAALARVQAERFDLAVIDYFMPGLNGAALCRALRDAPSTRDITLAVLTGSYEDGLISDCLEAGAMECMFKNESDELFIARVDSLARLREREQRLKAESQRLELILASVGDGVYGVDRTGRITFVNPAALRLLQCAHEDELVGLPAHERIHHADERGAPFRPRPASCNRPTSWATRSATGNRFWRAGELVKWSARAPSVSLTHQTANVGVVGAFRPRRAQALRGRNAMAAAP